MFGHALYYTIEEKKYKSEYNCQSSTGRQEDWKFGKLVVSEGQEGNYSLHREIQGMSAMYVYITGPARRSGVVVGQIVGRKLKAGLSGLARNTEHFASG